MFGILIESGDSLPRFWLVSSLFFWAICACLGSSFLQSVQLRTLWCFRCNLHNKCSYARFVMFEVSAIAQQCIVDALKPCEESSQTVVLCHTPSEICTDGHLTLGTHDPLEDFIGKESLS